MRIAIVAVVVAGCAKHAPTDDAHDLAAVLAHATDADAPEWKLDRGSFDSIVVAPFRSLYDDYAARFSVHIQPGTPEIRRHFAGDPHLSRAQARLRWALPVMYPAYVASTSDTVFVKTPAGWRALAGLDEAMLARVRSLDAACADRVALAGPPGACSDVGWVIADAALRGDRARMQHACQLAATTCLER